MSSKYLLFLAPFFISITTLGQTGPGGVATNLELWYKANTGAENDGSGTPATNGDAVQIWQDQSGNNFDADQSGTSGSRPVYSTNAADVINGNPVLVFDGNDDYFPISTLNYSPGSSPAAITVYSVLTTTNAGEGVILSYDRNEYFRFATDHQNDGGFGLSTTASDGTTDDFNANGTPEDDGVPHILGGRFDPSIAGTNKFLYFDGAVDNSTDAGTTFGTTQDRFGFIGVGSEAAAFDGSLGPTNYLEGNLAEVFYYDGALTDAERQQVESYLAIKYGITLSSDTDGDGTAFETGGTVDEGDYLAADGATVVWDASANQTYHNDIAAIGVDTESTLSQSSSQSINSSAIVSITDAALAENEYVVWGSNGGTLGSSASSATSFERELNRVWKVQITGATTEMDNITIDLSGVGVLPESSSDIALLIDDNESFTSPTEITTGTFVNDVLSISNVNLSTGGDIFFTVAFNLQEPGGIATIPAFWFRADAGVEEASNDDAEDGDAVQFWLDQSGNGYNGEQSDVTDRPTFSQTSSINNNPVLSFDGSSSNLPIRDLNYDLTTNTLGEITIFSVVKSDQTDEGIIVSFDRSSFFRFALNHQNNPNFGLSTNVGTDIDDFNANTPAEDGFAHLVAADFNASSNSKNLYLDGVADATNGAAHSPAGSNLGNTDSGDGEIPRFGYIGTGSEANTFDESGSPGNILNGDLAEIIYYESELSAADRLRIESYLAIKYGLTLPGDYVSSDGSTVWDATANAGYLNGIAGIAVDDATLLSQSESQSETAGAILTAEDAGLLDGDYIIWGHDGDGTALTAGVGTRDSRIEREWKFQTTGSVSSINTVQIDISSFTILPSTDPNDYRLLLDNNADFSSVEQEITPSSLVNGVLTFSGVDVGTNVFVTLGVDPDLDGDGVADGVDIDEDNDGIPDIDEGSGTSVDTDGDGVPDYRDLDSDNDGIGDLYESGAEADGDVTTIAATLDSDDDGIIDASVTPGTNGLADILETSNDNGTLSFTVNDDDSDGVADFRDLDTDNNGLSDLAESGQSTGLDTDDNGVFDDGVDNDGDGISDDIDIDANVFGSANLSPQNLDGTGEPDFRDLDNDGDGTFDVVELALTDDGAGRLDLTGETDNDGDGVYTTDGRDSNDATFGFVDLASLQSGSGTDWYSYKSGDWTDPDNWTTDPSGTVRVNPGSDFPNSVDENVFILNGDEMTLGFDNLIVSSMTINNGGAINIGTTVNHNFNTISGRGTIKLASDEFPGGDASAFNASDGGTVEYVDQSPAADYELISDRTFNNLVINSATNTVVLKADYTLNGDLTVRSGTLQINDNTTDAFADNTTPLNLLINGDITVDASGAITVGNVDASNLVSGSGGIFTFHEIELLGDFTNNGTVDFENLSGTSISDGRYRDKYPTAADADNNTGSADIPSTEYGAVEVLLTNGSEDQLVTLNGPTDFYRIEVDKGTSQTFIAEFNASSTANFRLLGRIAMDMSDDSDDTPNIENHRALGLESGILKLGDNIVVDQIAKEDPNGTDPSTQGGNRNYIIDLDAQLWLSSNASVTKSNDWGIHPFGKLKVSDNATLDFTGTGQRAILIDNQGVYEQTGGTVNIGQFRNKTGADGAPRGSFIMTGGTLNVGQAGTDGNHAVFSIPWADQNLIFKAADPANPPVINITLDANNRGKDNAAVQIGVKEGNYDIGEGTINIIHTANADYKFSSTSPLYDLSYDNSGSGELIFSDIVDADDDGPATGVLPDDNSGNIPSPAQFAQPLTLLNDLTITDGRLDANDLDITIGNLLTIVDGGEYDPGSNTTLFNGSSPIQRIGLNGTAPLIGGGFNNVSFSTSGTTKEFEGDLGTVVILGNLTIGEGVNLNDNGKVLQVNGNISHSGTHETDDASPGRIELTGGSATHEIDGDGTGQFKILTLDDANGAVFLADQEVDSVLNLVDGVLDIDTYKLTVNSTATDPIVDDNSGDGATNNFVVSRMIQTAGNASDGGLEFFIDNDGTYIYPLGVSGKYTPVDANISLTNSNTGFVQIRPVNDVLGTVAQTSDEILNYYWRVSHSGFGSSDLPTINSYTFTYDAGDASGGTPDTDYVAGKVLDESPFTRAYEGAAGVQVDASTILFDGLAQDDDGSGSPGPGFTVENANYTAGEDPRFVGAPQTFYTRKINNSSTTANAWSDPNSWSFTETQGPANTAGEIPGAGDIVIFGAHDSDRHGFASEPIRLAVDIDTEVASALFEEPEAGESRARVFPREGTNHNWGFLGGSDGEIQLFFTSSADVPTFDMQSDLGEFLSNPNSTWNLSHQGGLGDGANLVTMPAFPAEFPTLRVTGSENPAPDLWSNRNILTFQTDVEVNNSLQVANTAGLLVTNDISIQNNLDVGVGFGNGAVRIDNNDSHRISIGGDLRINGNSGGRSGDSFLEVEGGGSAIEHRIIVDGNIELLEDNTADGNDAFLDLFSATGQDNAILELAGNNDGVLSSSTNQTPDLYRLVVNKGSDQNTTFTINDDFNLNATASGATKSIELQNGTLILNNSGIDIDLNAGGGDFTIPATAGLEIQDGTARVSATGTGAGNGIRLDGKITLSGGDLILDGDPAANNYIEYGSGGSAEIEISDASSELVVGSQLRRNTLSDDGVITYTQTAGTAIFGANTAPVDSRGVFEIFNTDDGSAFTLTGAGTTFAIVNGQGNPELGTFILEDGSGSLDVTFDNNAIIDFGFNGTVAGTIYQNDPNETYEINSDAAIPNLRIDNDNFNTPILEMVIQPLTVSNNLEILNGGSLVANDFDLTVNSGFTNDGTYTPGVNTTIFNGSTQTILGTTATVFNNLDINPTTDVTLGNDITVNQDLNILTGLLDDAGNRISLLGNLNITTEHLSDGSGTGGIAMENPTDPQEMNLPDNEAEIDHLIVDNTEGITMNDNSGTATILTIDQEMAINDGVFLVGDNRLIFDNDAAATTTSSFTASRMISVNGVKKSDGVEKEFLASTDAAPFVIPVGTPDKYTPVTLDVDGSDDPGSILIKPINAVHPSADATLTGDPAEMDALNYYWVASSSPVSNFLGEIIFQYVEEDANGVGQNESTWTGVRLIAPNWSKPPGAVVDEAANTITFDQTDLSAGGSTTFDGEFTAGNDIPDELAAYRSNKNGTWNTAADWDIENDGDGLFDDGNGVPQPGSQVIIRGADEITMTSTTDNDQNIFSVEIDGILDVGDSDGHNFGDISGTGTLRVTSNTTSIALPGGNYDAFFTTGDGALDFAGTGNYTIPQDFSEIRGLTISDGGTKTLPDFTLDVGTDGITILDGATLDNNTNNNILNVSGDVNIVDGTFNLGGSAASLSAQNLTLTTGTFNSSGADIDLSGDVSIDGGTFSAGSGNLNLEGDFDLNAIATFNNNSGTIIFDGASDQNLTGDFSTGTFNDLQVNKSGGELVLGASADVQVSNVLALNGGNINTQASAAAFRLLNGVGSISRTSGYINGPLQVDLTDDDAFNFPLGKSGNYKPLNLKIQNSSQSANPLTWEVEYYSASAETFSNAGVNDGIDLNAIETNPTVDEQVTNMNGSEFWRMDTGGGTATAETITLDISDTNIDQNNINDQELQVMVWDDTNQGGADEWVHLGGNSSGTPSSANVVSTVTLGFSEKILTSGAEAAIPLPVELVSFTGSSVKTGILLEWSTASEIENDYFEILRSIDGENFEVIGEVDGNGNSTELIEYEFLDRNPLGGANYYRLRQVDFDGDFEFSPVIRVDVEAGANASVTLYPNPVGNQPFNLLLEGYQSEGINGIYILHSTDGRIIERDKIDSRNTELSLDGEPEGLYFLKVHIGSKYYNMKIIKR